MSESDSKFFVMTPTGRGAVATLCVFSPDLPKVLDQHFLPANGQTFSQNANRKIIYGRWEADGEDLIVCPRDRNSAEIHCHGGHTAITAITESLLQSGFAEANQEEIRQMLGWSRWTTSLRQCVAKAPSGRTAKLILNQISIADLRLCELIKLIEAKKPESISQIDSALAWSKFAYHLTKPWSIVLCGAPNVGKSSLINAIAGFGRAIVHATPGTTRDVISISTAIDGWPVVIKDTAGIRETEDDIESAGVALAREQLLAADCIVLVLDATTDLSNADELIGQLNPDLIAINKSDLAKTEISTSVTTIATSATTDLGISELLKLISNQLVPSIPGDDELLVVDETQESVLQSAKSLLMNDDCETASQTIRQVQLKP